MFTKNYEWKTMNKRQKVQETKICHLHYTNLSSLKQKMNVPSYSHSPNKCFADLVDKTSGLGNLVFVDCVTK